MSAAAAVNFMDVDDAPEATTQLSQERSVVEPEVDDAALEAAMAAVPLPPVAPAPAAGKQKKLDLAPKRKAAPPAAAVDPVAIFNAAASQTPVAPSPPARPDANIFFVDDANPGDRPQQQAQQQQKQQQKPQQQQQKQPAPTAVPTTAPTAAAAAVAAATARRAASKQQQQADSNKRMVASAPAAAAPATTSAKGRPLTATSKSTPFVQPPAAASKVQPQQQQLPPPPQPRDDDKEPDVVAQREHGKVVECCACHAMSVVGTPGAPTYQRCVSCDSYSIACASEACKEVLANVIIGSEPCAACIAEFTSHTAGPTYKKNAAAKAGTPIPTAAAAAAASARAQVTQQPPPTTPPPQTRRLAAAAASPVIPEPVTPTKSPLRPALRPRGAAASGTPSRRTTLVLTPAPTPPPPSPAAPAASSSSSSSSASSDSKVEVKTEAEVPPPPPAGASAPAPSKQILPAPTEAEQRVTAARDELNIELATLLYRSEEGYKRVMKLAYDSSIDRNLTAEAMMNIRNSTREQEELYLAAMLRRDPEIAKLYNMSMSEVLAETAKYFVAAAENKTKRIKAAWANNH